MCYAALLIVMTNCTRLGGMARTQTMAVFIALLALVALPGLCTAGVLLHVCDCGEAEVCGHESECSDDPCGTIAARVGSQIIRVEAPSWVSCACSVSGGPSLGSRQAAPPESDNLARSGLAINLGCPPGDLPLLI